MSLCNIVVIATQSSTTQFDHILHNGNCCSCLRSMLILITLFPRPFLSISLDNNNNIFFDVVHVFVLLFAFSVWSCSIANIISVTLFFVLHRTITTTINNNNDQSTITQQITQQQHLKCTITTTISQYSNNTSAIIIFLLLYVLLVYLLPLCCVFVIL